MTQGSPLKICDGIAKIGMSGRMAQDQGLTWSAVGEYKAVEQAETETADHSTGGMLKKLDHLRTTIDRCALRPLCTP